MSYPLIRGKRKFWFSTSSRIILKPTLHAMRAIPRNIKLKNPNF